MKNFKFTGNGWEYFKIWIVNILLTLITVGIYYPWARVRNNKYLYANSTIEGRNFDYHATGKQLLFGYLIAIACIFIYKFVETISPKASLFLLLILFIAIPWLILRSMKFNLNVTSFNNVRFKFNGNIKKAYIIFLGLPIVFLITFALIGFLISIFKNSTPLVILGVIAILAFNLVATAYFAVVKSKFLINYSDYGDSSFDSNLTTKEFIKILLKSFFVSILVFFILGILLALLVYFLVNKQEFLFILQIYQVDPSSAVLMATKIFFPIFICAYLILIATSLISYAYYITRQRAYIYSNVKLDRTVSFTSTMKFIPYAKILITNFIIVIFTLGLAYPWAKVRVAKYTLDNTTVDANEGFDGYISKKEKQSGFADQMGDTLDIDIGIPL